jgi:hypothetical protein
MYVLGITYIFNFGTRSLILGKGAPIIQILAAWLEKFDQKLFPLKIEIEFS